MARFSTRKKTPSARVAAQPSDTGRNVRVRRNTVRLQPPRTPISPHLDSVVSDVAPSVSSAAALNVVCGRIRLLLLHTEGLYNE